MGPNAEISRVRLEARLDLPSLGGIQSMCQFGRDGTARERLHRMPPESPMTLNVLTGLHGPTLVTGHLPFCMTAALPGAFR